MLALHRFSTKIALLSRALHSRLVPYNPTSPSPPLKGGYSWTAQQSDFDQQFIIDLGDVRNITRIETQGRPHSNEYLTEYSISYGFNGLDYIDYREPGGNTKVTKGAEEQTGRNRTEETII